MGTQSYKWCYQWKEWASYELHEVVIIGPVWKQKGTSENVTKLMGQMKHTHKLRGVDSWRWGVWGLYAGLGV